MKKLILMTIISLVMIQSALAVCCQINQNCTIIETCQSGACQTCSIKIYNATGIINQSGDFGAVTAFTYEYNLSPQIDSFGTYPYVVNCTTGDSCIAGDCAIDIKQNCEGIQMDTLGMIIFIPIALAFFYLIVSWLVRGKAHWAMSIALLLLAFVEFFRAYHFGMVSVVKYFNFPEMQNAIGTGTYSFGIMYGVVITYFIIHILILITVGLMEKKQKKIGEYGEYEW